jgi:hypothetical protein
MTTRLLTTPRSFRHRRPVDRRLPPPLPSEAMAETPPSDDDAPEYSTEQVDEIVANRAAIEQAKGVLMSVYGIDSHDAFELLRSRARTTQVKLRLLAEQLIVDVLGLTLDERRDMASACTNLLLTAHKRVRRDADDS